MAEKNSSKSSQGAAVLTLPPAPPPGTRASQPPPPRRERWEDAIAVVTVRGDLDRDGIEAIDFAVMHATAEAGRIVLDLLDVAHLDYAGVGLLVERRRDLSARGGQLLIAVRNPYVANILRAGGGADLVLCKSVEEASGALVSTAQATRQRRSR